jgi:hypothetical protein
MTISQQPHHTPQAPAAARPSGRERLPHLSASPFAAAAALIAAAFAAFASAIAAAAARRLFWSAEQDQPFAAEDRRKSSLFAAPRSRSRRGAYLRGSSPPEIFPFSLRHSIFTATPLFVHASSAGLKADSAASAFRSASSPRAEDRQARSRARSDRRSAPPRPSTSAPAPPSCRPLLRAVLSGGTRPRRSSRKHFELCGRPVWRRRHTCPFVHRHADAHARVAVCSRRSRRYTPRSPAPATPTQRWVEQQIARAHAAVDVTQPAAFFVQICRASAVRRHPTAVAHHIARVRAAAPPRPFTRLDREFQLHLRAASCFAASS